MTQLRPIQKQESSAYSSHDCVHADADGQHGLGQMYNNILQFDDTVTPKRDEDASARHRNSLKCLTLLWPWSWTRDLQNPISSSVASTTSSINQSLVKFLPLVCKISC